MRAGTINCESTVPGLIAKLLCHGNVCSAKEIFGAANAALAKIHNNTPAGARNQTW